jgi:hypothetical protein
MRMSPMKDPALKRKTPLEPLFDLLTRFRPIRRSVLTEKEKVSLMLCLSNHVYGANPLPKAPMPLEEAPTPQKAPILNAPMILPKGWQEVSAAEREELGLGALQLWDDHSGFNSQLYRNNSKGHYVYAFQGTNLTAINDWLNNVMQGGGVEADQYKLGLENGLLLSKQLGTVELQFTGHSLGGGLAAAAATAAGVKAITFNAAGVHANTLKKYGKVCEDALPLVINYFIPGELLTFLQTKTLMPDAIGIQKELPAPLLNNQAGKLSLEGNLIEAAQKFKTYLADYTEEEKRIFEERYRRHLLPALYEAVDSM